MRMLSADTGVSQAPFARTSRNPYCIDISKVNSLTRSQPSFSLIQRLRDLERGYYDPSIPCEAYEPGLGYTITII